MAMSSSQATSPVSRLKKIELFAAHLMTEATAKDKEGRIEEAVVDYLQAADMLLLLSKNQEDYTVWKGYTDRATACQQRVKVLMAKRRLESDRPS